MDLSTQHTYVSITLG